MTLSSEERKLENDDKRRQEMCCVVGESQVTEASKDLGRVQSKSQVPEAAKNKNKNKNVIENNKPGKRHL